MKDCFGQEIKVGNFVVPTNRSTAWFYNPENIPVVTRLGSDTKVQVNGGSYFQAEYLLVVDAIYKQQFGEEKYNERIAKVQEEFNESQVKKKPPSKKWYVLQVKAYNSSEYQKPLIFVFGLQNNTKSEDNLYIRKILAEKFSEFNGYILYCLYKTQVYNRQTLEYEDKYSFDYGLKSLQQKIMKELNIELKDAVYNEEDQTYKNLTKYFVNY